MSTKEGCNSGRLFTNIFAYANDMVLLAPSWGIWLTNWQNVYFNIDLLCNAEKTVCAVFPPMTSDVYTTNLLVGLGYIQTQLLHFLDHFVFFYGIELWRCYTVCAINRLRSCYIYSGWRPLNIQNIIVSLVCSWNLAPRSDTLIINSHVNLTRQLHGNNNSIIIQLGMTLGLHVI